MIWFELQALALLRYTVDKNASAFRVRSQLQQMSQGTYKPVDVFESVV